MKKVFLHEPDPGIFEVMALVLEQQGYQVEHFPYLENNISSKILAFGPDLVIIDCFQDMLRPARFCRVIRSLCPHAGLIVSSCNNDIDCVYKKMGFDCYLRKPFDIDELAELVRIHSHRAISC